MKPEVEILPRYVEPLFRPPSEAGSLIFQITVGCSQNRCAFCGMYKGKQFQIRPVGEVLAEIDAVPVLYRNRVERIFLADGDALIYPQDDLVTILSALETVFPRLARVASYASPRSLAGKSENELRLLRKRRLRILYFGLESGDACTLDAVQKGYTPDEMAVLAVRAREAGMKLSVTAILGLAGKERSLDHARSTAAWVNRVNPEYFSLLTLFNRHNDDFIRTLRQCTCRDLLAEAHELLTYLNPARTIFRSNHVSNFLNLAGSYPKDRQRLIDDVERAMDEIQRYPELRDRILHYSEEQY